MKYPKITIVTPSYNQGKYIEETILSVVNQSYPNLEYIIIDGGSNDNSVSIIKKYSSQISYWESEQDKGMYYALNKGFAKGTGEIMGWLNSDDKLHPKALFSVAEIFQLRDVHWITGTPTTYDEYGRTVSAFSPLRWSKYKFYLNDKSQIQQESTYWTRSLWERAGAFISTNYKYAGDFELWSRFFLIETLYTTQCLIGGFRFRKMNQLSFDNWEEYNSEMKAILAGRLSVADEKILVRLIRLNKTIELLKLSKIFNHASITSRIESRIRQIHNFPPKILFDREKHKFSFEADIG